MVFPSSEIQTNFVLFKLKILESVSAGSSYDNVKYSF